MGTRVSVSVHPDPETFRLFEFPDSEAGPFVSLRLGDVALLVSDPAVMTSLMTLAGQGAAWLTTATAGHPSEPEQTPDQDQPASEPKSANDTAVPAVPTLQVGVA